MDEKLLAKERKINRLHLIYGFVILAILGVCLLVIVPGCINPDAFDNFCFASTIVSIVLAVVSIVYSFRTKNNASDNMAGIREIERGIDDKLRRFDELEKHIISELDNSLQSGINPLHQDVSSLHDDQVGLRESIEEIKEEMRQQSIVAKESNSDKKDKIATRFNFNSFLGNIALYLACLSYKSHKSIDLARINVKLEQRKDYLYGYLIALVVAFPDSIKAKSDSGKTIVGSEFTLFDEEVFGNEDVCRQRVVSYKDKDLVNEYLEAISAFFS